MESKEKFDLKKLFDFSPHAYYKVFGLAIKIGMILLVLLGILWIKNLMFPAQPENLNQPTINVAEGGAVTYEVNQNKDERRIEYFGGAYGDKEKVGLFGGIKW